MEKLKNKLENKFIEWRKEASDLIEESGDKIISDVNISQVYGGMRGVKALLCDTSSALSDKGLLIRGRELKSLINSSPEEIYYLLLTGDMPEKDELAEFSESLKSKKGIPAYVWEVIKSLPSDSHPMTMLSAGILSMQRESIFTKEYIAGVKSTDYWMPTLADSLNLVAKIPELAAGIYRIKFRKGELIKVNSKLDMAGDFIRLLGIEDSNGELYKLMKLYLILHSDHESGNVGALSSLSVNSALSDIYYSISAGLNGLAGPLYGLLGQESLRWIIELNNKFGGRPSTEQIREYVEETISEGKTIPGYDNAELRVVDPRFEALMEFGAKYCSDSSIFRTVVNVYETIPDILKQTYNIKNPWPNVDAISGSLLYHYGLEELSFYTVIFGVSRILGMTAQAVVARGLETPIMRPKSITTSWIKEYLDQNSLRLNK